MSNILDIFVEAKSRFHVIGVVGMESCGKSEFFDTARDQRLMAVTQNDLMTQLLRQMIDAGDTTVVAKFAEYGVNIVDGQGKASWTDDTLNGLWELGITNANFYKDMCNLSFNQAMKVIAGRLDVILKSLPGIRSKNQLPIFIELPLATGIDYKQYVNEIVAITRPTDYKLDDWYVTAKVGNGNRYLYQFSPYFATAEEAAAFLKIRDNMWYEANIQPDFLIENTGPEDDFAREVLDFMYATKSMMTV